MWRKNSSQVEFNFQFLKWFKYSIKFNLNKNNFRGARHGIKMNGKLSRLEEQEKMFLEKYAPKDETQREETLEKTKKKKEKRKTTSSEIDCNESGFENVNDSDLIEDCDLTKKKNKKKKKSIDE